MVEITPAILETDLEEIRGHLARVAGLSPLVQLDVCDGKFVSGKTWPYVPGGIAEFARITSEEEGLPFWDRVDFEIDLMIRHPETVVEEWIKAGAKSVVLHLDSTPDMLGLIEHLRQTYGSAKSAAFGLKIGVALGVRTANEGVYSILDMVDEEGDSIIDFVQFMGIEQIGFQGQEFDDRVLEKISDLRNLYPNISISVDGGVNFDNAADLISAGATRLVSGSAIFNSADLAEAINDLAQAGE